VPFVGSGSSRVAPADVDGVAMAAPLDVSTATVVATVVADSARTIGSLDQYSI
jgi:hypothetical protein